MARAVQLRLFTFHCVAHKRVTKHVIMLKEIFDKQDSISWKHTSKFVFVLKLAEQNMSFLKTTRKINKIVQNYKGITSYLAWQHIMGDLPLYAC